MSLPLLRTILQSSALITVGNACAYLTQIILARSLTPAEFGAANAILALSITIVAPLAVSPMVISKMLIDHANEPAVQAGLIRRIIAASAVIAGAIWLAHLPFGALIMDRMQISAMAAYVLLPLIVATTFLYHLPIGFWQGKRNYPLMAGATASVPILRCVVTILLVTLLGGGLTGALWALILSGGLGFAWGVFSVWGGHPKPAPPLSQTWKNALAFALPASLGMLGLLGLAYVDQPIVRALATPDESGQYAAASTLAKIALLLPAAVTSIVFPEAAKLGQKDEAGREASIGLIATAILSTVAISGGATLVMMAAPQLILELLAGKAYVGAAPLLRLLAPAMTLLAVVTLLVTYALARGRLEVLWPTMIALVVAIAGPLWLKLDPVGTAKLMLVVLAALCASCMVWLIITHAPRHSR